MQGFREPRSHGIGHRRFRGFVVQTTVGWKRRLACCGSERVGQTVEVKLARHFETDDAWDPTKVLTALDFDTVAAGDADVQVLPNRTESATNAPRSTQHGPKGTCGGLGVVRRLDVRGRGDFDQRKTKAVKVVEHALARFGLHGRELSCAVFLQANDVDAHRPFRCLKGPVLSHQRRPLETARVGAVNHRLAHGLHQVHRASLQQRRDGEGHVHGVVVKGQRRAFVEFDEPGVGRLNVLETSTALGLKPCGDVHGATFTSGCSKAAACSWPRFRDGFFRDIVEFAGLTGVEFPRRQLLVNLNPAHEAQGFRVEGVGVTYVALGLRHGHATHTSDMSATVGFTPP